MRTLDVDFGDSPFELAIARLKKRRSFPAGRFLTPAGRGGRETVEAAFETLAGASVGFPAFPRPAPTGSGAARLHWRKNWQNQEHIAENLPEEDPLRLYLEELSQAEGGPHGEKMLPKVVDLARGNMWATANAADGPDPGG